jgi:hypothetical protein
MTPEMTWEYCMQQAFEAMHTNWTGELQKCKVDAWLAIAREIRQSELVTEAAIQKIIAEAKPV